jgi:UDP-N-acetylmuramyl pentapeptide phosphotransferase/UDP-N-acetylglucosamine-1-phosphate transferase
VNISLFLISLGLSTLLHFFIQKVFIFYNRFDDFNHRSSHKALATRTGGIGLFLTLLIISLFHYFNKIELFDYSLFIPLGIMLIVGVYDDLYKADFKLKFLLQIIVAKILIDQGYVISNYYGLFGQYEIPWLLAQLTTIFVFLVLVNSINFIDGIDGLSISQVIKTILLIEFFSEGNTSLEQIGVITIGAIMPLYYLNFKKKRKVFLGDGGSLFLGTLLMIYTLTVLGYDYSILKSFSINKVLFAVLALLYPLVDLLRVFVLRIKDGQSPFIADKRHLHHILNKKLNSHLKTTLLILFSSIIIVVSLILIS